MPWFHDVVAVGTSMGYVRCCVCSPDEGGVPIFADNREGIECDGCGCSLGGETTGDGKMRQGDRPAKRTE